MHSNRTRTSTFPPALFRQKLFSLLFTRLLFAKALLFASLSVYGNTETRPNSLLHFEIKPVACLAQYMGQECELQVEVNWHLSQPNELCLLQLDRVLKCWERRDKTIDRLNIKLQESTVFYLVTKANKQVIKEQQVTINYLNKYRRRLKPRWSIF